MPLTPNSYRKCAVNELDHADSALNSSWFPLSVGFVVQYSWVYFGDVFERGPSHPEFTQCEPIVFLTRGWRSSIYSPVVGGGVGFGSRVEHGHRGTAPDVSHSSIYCSCDRPQEGAMKRQWMER